MKILIVDDDASNRTLATRMLGLAPHVQVSQASDGQAALTLAEQQPFDAVLLDISMPGLDGVAACERLRRLPGYAGCLIVACTAHASRSEVSSYLKAGFSKTLTKPFVLQQLYSVLDLRIPAGF